MAAIATEAATSNPSSEFRNYELAEHRDEKGCRGPTVEWWTSLQPVVADVQLGSASRSRQLREDGDSNKIYEIGQMTGPILDDGLEMTMATLPARGKKEDNHHQQQVSVVKRSSQPLAKGRSRQLQDIDARGEAVSDQASWDRDSVGAVLKIDDLLSEGIRARCYQDSNGVNRCNPNFYFFGTSKCGEQCGLHCIPFAPGPTTVMSRRKTSNKHQEWKPLSYLALCSNQINENTTEAFSPNITV